MPDAFVVGGKFVTGVGIWGRARNMYYWLEYDVPAGAKTFRAVLLVSDDISGWRQLNPSNQQFEFNVLVDGQQKARESQTRIKEAFGSGTKLKDIAIAIPAGAKKIRFRLDVSSWGAGNSNVELILSEGVFE
jgi:hypothetical protein